LHVHKQINRFIFNFSFINKSPHLKRTYLL
jgi:hypothetical protein